jgi:Cu-processing system permease protein
MVEIGGLIAVVFVGGQIVFREIEGKTIYLILSKPIPRRSFIVGKFLGFGAILLLIVAIQSVILF